MEIKIVLFCTLRKMQMDKYLKKVLSISLSVMWAVMQTLQYAELL